MLKNFLITLLSIFVFVSCQTKTNQYIKISDKVQKRHGKWKEEYPTEEGTLIATGRYKMGEKIGVWKTYLGDKLYQTEKIRRKKIKMFVYYKNGNIMERGQSKLDISETERHWYYFGDWKFYDENGKLKYIKKYTDGKKIDSVSLKN
jgi:antitoxin component YwqK of YwqJK toxin-antitoxin module